MDIGGIWNCSAWRRLGIEVFVPNIDLMIQRHIQTLLGRIRMGIHGSELQEGRFGLDMEKIFYTSSGEILGKKSLESFPGSPFLGISNPQLQNPALIWADLGPEASTDPSQPFLLPKSKEFGSTEPWKRRICWAQPLTRCMWRSRAVEFPEQIPK